MKHPKYFPNIAKKKNLINKIIFFKFMTQLLVYAQFVQIFSKIIARNENTQIITTII